MGWFSGKSESPDVGELVGMLQGAKNNAERRKILYKDAVKKKFNLSAKELKDAAKLAERMTQGEKGVKAFAAGFGDIVKGRKTSNYSAYTKLVKEEAQKAEHGRKPSAPTYLGLSGKPSAPKHPSVIREEIRSGKQAVTIQQALHIKQTDPELYQDILAREARRQGL